MGTDSCRVGCQEPRFPSQRPVYDAKMDGWGRPINTTRPSAPRGNVCSRALAAPGRPRFTQPLPRPEDVANDRLEAGRKAHRLWSILLSFSRARNGRSAVNLLIDSAVTGKLGNAWHCGSEYPRKRIFESGTVAPRAFVSSSVPEVSMNQSFFKFSTWALDAGTWTTRYPYVLPSEKVARR